MHEYANGGTWAGMLAKLSREQSTVTKSGSRKFLSLDGVQVFVLCGVRSESINASTVDQLWDVQGVYPFKHLVDGGCFVTVDTLATLEDAGVILFVNDASAKKRRVNTSFFSMEVSAASSLANEEINVHDVRVPTRLSKHAPQLDKGNLT